MKNIAVGLFIIAIFSCTKTVYVDVEKEIVKQILITEYVTPVNDFNPVYPVKVQSFVTSNFGYRKTIANTGGNAGGDIFHTGIDIGRKELGAPNCEVFVLKIKVVNKWNIE